MLVPLRFLVKTGFSSFLDETVLSLLVFKVVEIDSLLSAVDTLAVSFPLMAVVSVTLLTETDSEIQLREY